MIVGLGQIGMGYDASLEPSQFVYSHARAFSQHPSFRLVAGVDTLERLRDAFTQAYGVPAFAQLRGALVAHKPHIVVIAVPTAAHHDVLLEVLNTAKPEIILCEKPLAYDVAEARRMVRACDDSNVSLYVNYMRRSTPGAIEVKRRLASGAIASPIKGFAWYTKGFLHNASHSFNLLEDWLGEVRSFVVLDRGRDVANADAEPDVRVSFKLGTVVFQAAWEEAYSHNGIELLSPCGRLRYESGGECVLWDAAHAHPLFTGYRTIAGTVEAIESGMQRYQWHVADQLAMVVAGDPQARLCSATAALTTLVKMKEILAMEKR